MTESALQASIVLPWPDSRLNPNRPTHWGERARLSKTARLNAAWEARVQGAHVLEGCDCDKLRVRFVFHPPDRRRRDLDNLMASLKPVIDGVVDVIGIDDSKWRFTAEFGDVKPTGEVRLELAAEQAGRAA